jgi:hypothetical protein
MAIYGRLWPSMTYERSSMAVFSNNISLFIKDLLNKRHNTALLARFFPPQPAKPRQKHSDAPRPRADQRFTLLPPL